MNESHMQWSRSWLEHAFWYEDSVLLLSKGAATGHDAEHMQERRRLTFLLKPGTAAPDLSVF